MTSRWTSPCAWAAASPAADLRADAEDLFQLQRPGPVEPLLQRDAGDVLHDQVGQAVGLVHGVDGDDVLVADGGGGAGLARRSAGGRRRWLASCGASTLIATKRCSDGSNPFRTTPMPPRPTTPGTS